MYKLPATFPEFSSKVLERPRRTEKEVKHDRLLLVNLIGQGAEIPAPFYLSLTLILFKAAKGLGISWISGYTEEYELQNTLTKPRQTLPPGRKASASDPRVPPLQIAPTSFSINQLGTLLMPTEQPYPNSLKKGLTLFPLYFPESPFVHRKPLKEKSATKRKQRIRNMFNRS